MWRFSRPTRPESTRTESAGSDPASAGSVRSESAPPEPTRPEPEGLGGLFVSDPLSDPEYVAGLRPVPSGIGDSAPSWPAVDLNGIRPDGSLVAVEFDGRSRPVLLVFLTVDCDGCDLFWARSTDVMTELDVVAVTKDPTEVSQHDVAARATGPVVMSSAAWIDYRVTGYPFLVLIDPVSRRIVAESVGFAWSDVDSMLAALEPGHG